MNETERQRIRELNPPMQPLDPSRAQYTGCCVGGPYDGEEIQCDGMYFPVIMKVHPDVKESDGTWSRNVEYDTYYWVSENRTWRWGQHG